MMNTIGRRIAIIGILSSILAPVRAADAEEARVLASIGDYLVFEAPATLTVTVTGDASGSLTEDVSLHISKGGRLPEGTVYVQINALALGGRFLMRGGGFTIRGMNSESPVISDEVRATGNSVPIVDLNGDGRRENFHIEPGGAGVINRWAPRQLEMTLSFPAVAKLPSIRTDGSGRRISGTREVSVNVQANLRAAWDGPSIGESGDSEISSELDAIDTTEKPGHGNLYITAGDERTNTGVRVNILDRRPLRLDLELVDADGPQNAGLVLVFPGAGRPAPGTYVVTGQEAITRRMKLTLSGPTEDAAKGVGTVTIFHSDLITVGEIALPALRMSGRFGIDL